MSKIYFTQIDCTLDDADLSRVVQPFIEKYKGRSRFDICKWSSNELRLVPTYIFPDQSKKDAFDDSISAVEGVYVINKSILRGFTDEWMLDKRRIRP